jgi:hypothetical protein
MIKETPWSSAAAKIVLVTGFGSGPEYALGRCNQGHQYSGASHNLHEPSGPDQSPIFGSCQIGWTATAAMALETLRAVPIRTYGVYPYQWRCQSNTPSLKNCIMNLAGKSLRCEDEPTRFPATDAQMPRCRCYQMGNRVQHGKANNPSPNEGHRVPNKDLYVGWMSYCRLRGSELQDPQTRAPVHGIYW